MIDAEGGSCIYQAETYEYGIEPYDPAADSALFADYFAAASVPENLRTIRVVFDPDTENEKTAEAVLPVDVWFNVFHNGTFAKEIYADRGCTQPLSDYDVKEDMVMYVLSE